MQYMFPQFQWVADHEAKIWELDSAHRAQDYDRMRSIFSNTEQNDDDLRNKLYCYSGHNLDVLMSQLGPVPPIPKPPTPVHQSHPHLYITHPPVAWAVAVAGQSEQELKARLAL